MSPDPVDPVEQRGTMKNKETKELQPQEANMSEYEQQAIDFCNKWNVKMKVGTPKYDRMPWSPDYRYIFPVTLSKDGRRMTVQFGQSLAQGDNPPTAYDVLACLTKSDPGSFEDFCADYGYDTDSRKAECTYRAVKREWEKVLRVFGEGECLDDLQEIV